MLRYRHNTSIQDGGNSTALNQPVPDYRYWLFDEAQIQELVSRMLGSENSAEVLQRIVHQYPLEELARRPLMLGMVLQTLDQIDGDDRISRADL